MIYKADSLGWKNNKHIIIAVDNGPLCKNKGNFLDGSNGDNYHICILDNKRKYIVSHEIGHAIARMRNGLTWASYAADAPGVARSLNPKCYQGSNAVKEHIWHTREFIGAAAAEGFAHFMATATYNNNSATNATFVYYKNTYDPYTGKLVNDVYKMHPIPNTSGDYPQWTYKQCAPPASFKSLGSEGDWLNFFWRLWSADSSVRFSVAEMNKVWDEVSDKKIWSYCIPDFNTWEGTCKDYMWEKTIRVFKYNLPFHKTIIRPFVFHSVKYNRGKKWTDLRNSALKIYANNLDKYDHFMRSAEKRELNTK